MLPLAERVRLANIDQGDQAMSASIGEKISVCLLTYNHADVISSTIESILTQTINGYEIIISDDSSNDGTWERILEIAKRDKRIRTIRTPKNLGMPGNANFAVAQSNRPYIALLHHDDIYREDLLEKWADILERYPGVGFAFNPYDCQNPERHFGSRLRQECVDGRWFLETRLFARSGCPVRGTAMIRRSAWDSVEGMRERFELIADVDLWMRLSSAYQVGYVPEPLIKVRHLRPPYYPDIYTFKTWHWRRIVLAYEIHASNRLALWDLNTQKGKMKWWLFRAKISYQTARLLVYGLVKRRRDLLTSSNESVTEYDVWPLRAFRRMLQLVIRNSA